MSQTNVAIGIDLGTTNSCVAVFRNQTVEIIQDEHDNKISPSMVTFTDTKKLLGNDSKENEVFEDPESTVYGVKRLIGRDFLDPVIQDDLKHWPFKVVSDNGKPVIKVRFMQKERTFQPEEISAMVLEKMKTIAEAHLGHPVTDAVITVPAYFDNNQRQATRAAGQIAGLNVLRLMNEPTAAAVAYGLNQVGGSQRNVLVYDLGGGTFDVSVLSMDGATFQVKSITGDSHLGGEDFDKRMVDHFAKEITSRFGFNIFDAKYKKALRRLTRACEKAKIQLSGSPQAGFSIDSLIEGNDFDSLITRTKFEELNQDLFDSTLETMKKAIQDSKIDKNRIDDVVLVGGCTRIPKIRDMLEQFFTKQRINRNINPDEAVAYGAAVQAAQLAGNPSTRVKNLLLYDVVPLSLGLATVGDEMDPIILKNQPIPIRKSESYTTTMDNQTIMDLEIFEGERALIKDNFFLGSIRLTGIPPAERGYASIDVTFEIDDDCILHVKARDRDTGNEKSVSIVNNAKRLNEQQLRQLAQEAETYRLADQLASLKIGAMNELEFYMHDIRSALNNPDFVKKVRPQQKQEVLAEVDAVKSWLDSPSGKCANQKDYDDMRKKLETIWLPISTTVIQASGRRITDKPIIFMGD